MDLIQEPFNAFFLATILSKRCPRVKTERENVILTLTCVPFKLNFRLYEIICVFYLDAFLTLC
jgi:hypothetical protein